MKDIFSVFKQANKNKNKNTNKKITKQGGTAELWWTPIRNIGWTNALSDIDKNDVKVMSTHTASGSSAGNEQETDATNAIPSLLPKEDNKKQTHK